MIPILFALGIGYIVGLALAVVGIQPPAPSTLQGVAAILGLTLAYMTIGGAR